MRPKIRDEKTVKREQHPPNLSPFFSDTPLLFWQPRTFARPCPHCNRNMVRSICMVSLFDPQCGVRIFEWRAAARYSIQHRQHTRGRLICSKSNTAIIAVFDFYNNLDSPGLLRICIDPGAPVHGCMCGGGVHWLPRLPAAGKGMVPRSPCLPMRVE